MPLCLGYDMVSPCRAWNIGYVTIVSEGYLTPPNVSGVSMSCDRAFTPAVVILFQG